MAELSSQLKKRSHELREANRKVEDIRATLDCSWSLAQKNAASTAARLVSALDEECKLSTKAHLLLPVNDEAAADNEKKKHRNTSSPGSGSSSSSGSSRHRHSHHTSNTDNQHWLLG